jgi:hypothetical protein
VGVGISLAAAAACGKSSPTGPSLALLEGLYRLAIESDCAALPPDVRVRTYIASISGTTVSLSGATFFQRPSGTLLNTFSIATSGDTITLSIGQAPSLDARGIIEETRSERFLGIVGTGSGSIRRSTGAQVSIEGSLSAGFGWGENLLQDTQHVGCNATSHRATFGFTPGPTSFPAARAANTLSRLRLTGPASVAPGERALFSVSGEMTDGSARDVTGIVGWNRSSFAIDLGPSGEVTGRQVGESTLQTWLSVPNVLSPLRDSVEVIVVPHGTVRVAGHVSTSNPIQPVAGARIQIISGPSSGLVTVTDWEGRYKLHGVTGMGTLRISKDGYDAELRDISGSGHETVNVTLTAVAPVPDVSGTYMLTITADPGCSDPMPPSSAVRTYSARITQAARSLSVTLSGVPFFVIEGRGSSFPGQADPGRLTFRLDDNDHFDIGGNPDVVELLGGTRVLFLFGEITTDVTPNLLTGTLNGSLQLADRAWPSNGFFWGPACSSTRHQVTFSR